MTAIFGAEAPRLGNTLCFAQPGVAAEIALIGLDLAGVSVSAGSACSSGKVKRSHVLQAMGISDELNACALRISLGKGNTMREVEVFLSAWRDIIGRMAGARLARAV